MISTSRKTTSTPLRKRLSTMANKPCHYEVLGLDRSAKANEVKRSYRKLALNWHPDKNPNNRQEATEMFRLIAEAYDVLGDPEKRRLYDTYGHAGVEVGGDPRGAHAGGTAAAPGGEWGNSGDPFQGGTFRDPFEMFEAFFGASSANGAFGRVGGLFGRPTSMRDFSREPAFGHRQEVYPEHGGGRAAGRRNDGDFFGGDPFFRSSSMGHDMFRDFDGFMNSGFGGGSGFGGMGGGGGGFSSFSSTTVGPDGVPQTFSRTERVVLNPDGTRESKVEEFVDGVPVPASGGSIAPGYVQQIDNTTNVSSGRRGSRTGRNISRIFGGRPNW